MSTVLDLITSSLRLIGVVRKSESISADEAQDGLNTLNELLDSWSNETLLVPYRAWETFSVSSGDSYTIGIGQTINTIRPIDVINITATVGGTNYPLTRLTDEEFRNIPLPTTGSNIPQFFNYDNGYPIGKIRIYPTLSTSSTLNILSEKPLANFSTIADTVDLVAGAKRALRYNLAIDLAPEYGQPVTENIYTIAGLSKKALEISVAKNRQIKRINNNFMYGNIYNGWYQ